MLGISFADHLVSSMSRHRHRVNSLDSTELITAQEIADDKGTPGQWRKLTLRLGIIGCLGLVVGHIFILQIIRGKYYQGMADGNRIIKRTLEASRGVVIDRTGKVLVRNMPYVEINNKIISYKEYSQQESTLSAEQKKAAHLVSMREYEFSEQFAHVLGYISPVTQEELSKNKKLMSEKKVNYSFHDVVGRTGLEKEYESLLRGKEGTELVEVNALGEVQKVLGRQPAVPGYTLKSTLDAQLQEFSYKVLAESVQANNGSSGVVIVQDPRNGHILTLVSYPSYDNNAFTNPEKAALLEAIFTDKKTPLLNRAISGTYAPGSTFKIVTALAGLESKKITKDTQYEDTGSITLSGTTFNNWYFTQYGKNEGNIDVRKALARSNDTFFYKMALDTGVETLVEYAHKFKFGQVLGIDIPGESEGLIPTPQWKKNIKKEEWYPGNTVNMSIGQGDVLTTPLQINTMTLAIANKGTLYPPSLIAEVRDWQNNKICERSNENSKWNADPCNAINKNSSIPVKLNMSQENINAVREGMKMVTQQGGTAYPFFEYKIPSGGKTGTAESMPGNPPHAWYTAFAPYNEPAIALTVLVENGGEGSKVAAPLAKEIINYYFTEIVKNQEDALK